MTSDRAADNNVLILVISFGTSNQDTREKTIGAVEREIAGSFPGIPVRRAFTSSFIIRKLKQTEDLEIDNITDAMKRAHADGFRNLVIQPTHLMQGNEYEKIKAAVQEAAPLFDRITIGKPLLSGDEADPDALITALSDELADSADPQHVHLFMGHGSDAEANEVYALLQDRLTARGYENVLIATVEGKPSLEDAMEMLGKRHCKTVILQPLMVVAGDHAVNDMAGDEDSWKTELEEAGYTVRCVMKGLGEIPAVRRIYVEHVRAACGLLTE